MTDNVVPFAAPPPPPPGPGSFTHAEIIQAVAWVAPLGSRWGVETLHGDDGHVAIGLVAPSSERDCEDGDAVLAWHVIKAGRGVVLLDMKRWTEAGRFDSLAAALGTVERVELGISARPSRDVQG